MKGEQSDLRTECYTQLHSSVKQAEYNGGIGKKHKLHRHKSKNTTRCCSETARRYKLSVPIKALKDSVINVNAYRFHSRVVRIFKISVNTI